MRTVAFGDERYLLVERAGDACVLAHPGTGDRLVVPADAVAERPAVSPLATAAEAVDAAPELRAAVPDRRALGLLAELDRRGPTPVRALLEYDLCESDLHGVLAELSAAGLVAEARVAGERGYRLTGRAAALR